MAAPLRQRPGARRLRAATLLAAAALVACGRESSVPSQASAGTAGWPEIDARLERAVQPAADGAPCQGGYTAEACGLEFRFGPLGTTLYDRAFGAWTPDQRVPIASASKWLTAVAILTLVDQGQLELDAPIAAYWPGLDAAHGAITMRQLLSHTSGIAHQNSCTSDQVGHTMQQCAQEILLEPLVAEPGTMFLYGASGYQVAGAIAERISGQTWRDFFAQRLALPLGLMSTAYGSTNGQFADTTANPQLAGGGISTASDYDVFLQMLMQRGRHRGQQLISERAYAEMERSATRGVTRFECPLTEVDCYAIWPTAGFALGNPAVEDYAYGLGNWLIRVDGGCNGVLVSSPGAYGVHGWIDTQRQYRGLLFMNGNYTAAAEVFADLVGILDHRLPVLAAATAAVDCNGA